MSTLALPPVTSATAHVDGLPDVVLQVPPALICKGGPCIRPLLPAMLCPSESGLSGTASGCVCRGEAPAAMQPWEDGMLLYCVWTVAHSAMS